MNTIPGPWRDRCDSITSALTYMMKHDIIVDAMFKRDKTNSVFAHKLVLSMWSPILADWISEKEKRQMFSITFSEDVDVLKALLEYLYSSDSTNSFSKMPIEKLIQAMEISERYGIVQVYKKCMHTLRLRKISPLNVIEYFDHGLRKNFNDIVLKCIKVFNNEGMSLKSIKEDFSVITILNILSLDRLALQNEAYLLNLAISWLSYPANKSYKSEVLSFIDLQSIKIEDYQYICKKFPHFFSDSELTSIILAVVRQDSSFFPEWYKKRITSVIKKSCFSCLLIHKRLKFSNNLHSLKVNKRRDLKFVLLAFEFQFEYSKQARLLSIELNFGPREIPAKEFTLMFSKSRSIPMKDFSIDNIQGNDKYTVSFNEPFILKSEDILTLKFNFRKGLIENKVHVALANIMELTNLKKASNKDAIKVKLSSPKLAYYLSESNIKKFLVSSFCFNICDHHKIYLRRKHFENFENVLKHTEFEDPYSAMRSSNINIDIKRISMLKWTKNAVATDTKISIKKDFDHIMDTEDNCFTNITNDHTKTDIKQKDIQVVQTIEDQNSSAQITNVKQERSSVIMDTEAKCSSKMFSDVHTNASIKKEDIHFALINEDINSSMQIIPLDSIKVIKQELIDLTEGL